MARVVSVGAQDFEELVKRNNFYVDKTLFIKEWWENEDKVTLITRPRRFGKTLNMNMLERFWSIKYAEQGEIFQHLNIWKERKYRKLQGTYPVISLSFALIKETDFSNARAKLNELLVKLYEQNAFLKDSGILGKKELEYYDRVSSNMNESDAALSLYQMSDFLCRYYRKKVIILLDEYDTPMQEAYVNGYWKEMAAFTRNLFNAAFKTNPWLERAVMTGITRVGRESMFSDLNNINIITMTSKEYSTCFGFTEEEVYTAMDEFGLGDKTEVKKWYDGFIIGNRKDIYNPWSIINYLNKGQLAPYWTNTSSNALANSLIRKGSRNIKMQFGELLKGNSIRTEIDEEIIIYTELDQNENSIWSLLLASGYLKVLDTEDEQYELVLTNHEVEKMFSKMVKTWFRKDGADYNDFITALLQKDVKAMNKYMNRVSGSMFSTFDAGNHPSEDTNPERFYHGFVLGLLVDLQDRYVVTSNRESGFGRYDVLLEPKNNCDDGIILEFKVHDPEDETELQETVQAALRQIEEKNYEQILLDRGIKKEKIQKYGFAFKGKKVLIG